MLSCFLALFGFLSVLLPSSGVPKKGGERILRPAGRVQDVLFLDLEGDGLEDCLAFCSLDAEGDAQETGEKGQDSGSNARTDFRVQVFFQEKDGAFRPGILPVERFRGLCAVIPGDFMVSPGTELLLVGPSGGRVLCFDADRNALLAPEKTPLESLFHGTARGCPPVLRTAVDLDRDGLQDALVPVPGGYRPLLSRSDGSFRVLPRLDASTEWSIQFSKNSSFSLMTLVGKIRALPSVKGPPFLVAERDGCIVAWRYRPGKGDFVFMKSREAGFSPYPPGGKEGVIAYTGVMLTGEAGGGGALLVRSRREGKPGVLAALKTVHTVYRVAPDASRGTVELEARQRIVTDGLTAAPAFPDLNADGRPDLVFLYVKTSVLTKLLETLLDRVIITCDAFLFHPEEGRFSFSPDWSGNFSVPSRSFRTVGVQGLVRCDADFTGDGRPDLMVYSGNRILLERGVRESGFFSHREVAFKSRPFYQIGEPFPGPVFTRNIDFDPCPEVITFGGGMIRIIHVH